MDRILTCLATCTFGLALSVAPLSIAAQAELESPAAKKRAKTGTAARQGTPYAQREDAMRLADELAQRQGLDADWTRRAIGRAQHLPLVARLVTPAPSGVRKNWAAYRARFVEPLRIKAGVRFWREQGAALERAEKEWGVPAEIIVGVIGVETIYGQQMGDFRVIDALATLAFDHPAAHPRAAERALYFRGELEQFLAWQHRTGSDPLKPLGSFAGAMGYPQFMPSSWQRWAVDFDGDGRIDLWASREDAIGSVAHYLKAHGWQPGQAAHFPVRVPSDAAQLDELLAPDILPTFSVERFTQRGAVLEGDALMHPGPLALIELQNGDAAPSYVAGTENFYAITRYNQSSYYAMAVIELGREVRAALPQRP